MGSQTLELEWVSHKSNMTSELHDLYLSSALLDVTIVCGEFSLKAHKTVLSAASIFFRKLFLDNPTKHPILIMTDVDFEDLKTIVEFIYQGKICISREKLTKFLITAERLKIKGLPSIEDMNLNACEQSEIDVDHHYSRGPREQTGIQPQLQDGTQVEDEQRKATDYIQGETNQEIQAIEVERSDDNCMYWQSECFAQASASSVVSDCNSPNSSVSHQQSTPSVSHQSSPCILYLQPTAAVSHSERMAKSRSQTESRTQVQKESAGKDIIPTSLYKSQDQSPIIIPSSIKSYEAVESLNSQSSQDGKTNNTVFSGGTEMQSISGNTIILVKTEDKSEAPENYKCSFCQKLFSRHTALQKHLNVHSNIKRFVCPVCKYAFSQKSTLQIHLRTHTGEKPFECSVCHRRFSQLYNLQRHERTHWKETT